MRFHGYSTSWFYKLRLGYKSWQHFKPRNLTDIIIPSVLDNDIIRWLPWIIRRKSVSCGLHSAECLAVQKPNAEFTLQDCKHWFSTCRQFLEIADKSCWSETNWCSLSICSMCELLKDVILPKPRRWLKDIKQAKYRQWERTWTGGGVKGGMKKHIVVAFFFLVFSLQISTQITWTACFLWT